MQNFPTWTPAPTGHGSADFRHAAGTLATAVTVVSTDGSAGRGGQTVSAMSVVSYDPAIVLVCLYVYLGAVTTTHLGTGPPLLYAGHTYHQPTVLGGLAHATALRTRSTSA